MVGQQIEFAEALDRTPVGVAILDENLRYVFCNQELAAMNGMAAAEHIGKAIQEVVPTIAGDLEEAFRTVFRTGEPVRNLKVIGQTVQLADTPRTWLENVEPLPDENGRIRLIAVSVHEVTEVEELAAALRQSEMVLHASQEVNPDGFAVIRIERGDDGRIEECVWEYANPACQRFVPGMSLVGQKMFELVPEARALALPFISAAVESGQPAEHEATVTRRGRPTTHRVRFVPIDQDRLAVTFRDVSQAKRAEDERNLLLAEYRHRIKNMLAVVLALSSQLTRDYPEAAPMNEALQRMLMAMAIAQDYVGLHPTEPVELQRLVTLVLAPYSVAALKVKSGPPTPLAPEAAVPLALFLNELATNALKHGALAAAAGEAILTWREADNRICLEWHELGGVPAVPANNLGFGLKLLKTIEQMLPGGKLELRLEGELYAQLTFDR